MTRTPRASKTTKRKAKTSSTSRIDPAPAPFAPVPFALGLGANVGEPEANLRHAIRTLRAALGPLAVAPLYRTRPHSPIPQPLFFNTAVTGCSTLSPSELLALAKEIERQAGRREGPRLGPRPLDIDLLLYGGQVVSEPDLEVPHPRLRERRFVLAPLADLVPDLAVPPDGRTVRQLLAEVGQQGEVERLSWSEPP